MEANSVWLKPIPLYALTVSNGEAEIPRLYALDVGQLLTSPDPTPVKLCPTADES